MVLGSLVKIRSHSGAFFHRHGCALFATWVKGSSSRSTEFVPGTQDFAIGDQGVDHPAKRRFDDVVSYLERGTTWLHVWYPV